MRSKIGLIGLFTLVISLGHPLTALAQGNMDGEPVRLAGEISAIQGTTIVVDTFRGDEQRVRVDDDTQFRSLGGEIQGLEDLEIGMKVAVRGSQNGEIVFARWIAVGRLDRPEPFHRFRGEVVSIDSNSHTFTLENRQALQATFEANGETEFHARQGQFDSFEDLELGQRLAVVGRGQQQIIATHVLLMPEFENDRPALSIRLRGEISELGSNRLTVDSLNGDQVEFQLTENTKIRKLGGDDLVEGDKVAVLGFEDEQGSNVAVLVLARPAREGRFDLGIGPRLEGAPNRDPAAPAPFAP